MVANVMSIFLLPNFKPKLVIEYSMTFAQFGLSLWGKNMQRRLTKEEKHEMVILYKTNKYNFTQLAKIYKISVTAVSGLLKRRGYKAKSQSELQRKYKLDETFFDEIDTEEKAYFLGILFADGYNDEKRNCAYLSLIIPDKDILIKLKNLIQPEKPLQYIKVKNGSPQYRIVIQSKNISQKLSFCGCIQNKTNVAKFPTITKELENHFIRGYFDGDGCVTCYRNPTFSLVGTEEMLNKIQGILIRNCRLKNTAFSKRKPNHIVTCLRYVGRTQLKRIYDYLYRDASFYMERKKIKFEELLWCIEYSKKSSPERTS